MKATKLVVADTPLTIAEKRLAEAIAFVAENRPKLGDLAVSDVAAHNALSLQVEAQERLIKTLSEATIPAARAALAEAEARAKREALDGESADVEASEEGPGRADIRMLNWIFARAAVVLARIEARNARREAINHRRAAVGLQPIPSAEQRVRMIPGWVEQAVFVEQEEWQRGGQPVTFYTVGANGELQPSEAGAVKVKVRRCARPEQVIPPQFARSYLDTVRLPGLMPGDAAHWPKGGR